MKNKGYGKNRVYPLTDFVGIKNSAKLDKTKIGKSIWGGSMARKVFKNYCCHLCWSLRLFFIFIALNNPQASFPWSN